MRRRHSHCSPSARMSSRGIPGSLLERALRWERAILYAASSGGTMACGTGSPTSRSSRTSWSV
eukprot:11844372-Heterocapsa_arctica.AAC.1